MKKNGFTLVELLAVITILSLVALVTSISVANMLKESKDDLSDAQMKSIKLAAESWGADNIEQLPTGNSCSYITLQDLKNDGLLDSNVVDPKDKEELSNDLIIKISSRLNGKGKSILTYEVNPETINNCTYIGSPLYVDVPVGLTPVIYVDESTEDNPTKGYWKVPELNEEWYNYDEQMWANAVVLGNGKTKKPGDIVTVEGDNPDALMMLVYIPRYEYKIEGQYGTHTNGTPGTAEQPGKIEVKFVNSSQTTSDEGYTIHPAFIFDNKNLNGIWVGKFELSHKTLSSSTTFNNLGCSTTSCTNSLGLRVLPNVQSLRYNNVSNFWYAIKSVESTSTFGLNNMDTHMIKNSEWGAVAYLSQSKYGKYGNEDYDIDYKEIYQNKSNDYITGNSNGTIPQGSSTTQCAYNNMTKLSNGSGICGPGASTTGTIYGIYDTVGGAEEYVMGVYGSEKNPTISESGFSPSNIFTNETINSKYYDIYSLDSDIIKCNNNICYGHALSETLGWYEDDEEIITSSKPWVLRSCDEGDPSISCGIFYYANSAGNSSASTRFVGIVK